MILKKSTISVMVMGLFFSSTLYGAEAGCGATLWQQYNDFAGTLPSDYTFEVFCVAIKKREKIGRCLQAVHVAAQTGTDAELKTAVKNYAALVAFDEKRTILGSVIKMYFPESRSLSADQEQKKAVLQAEMVISR